MKHLIKTILAALSILSALNSCNTVNAKQEEKSIMVNGSEIPTLKERTGALAQATEWIKTKAKVEELIQKITARPLDLKLRLQLATIYMSEARITADAYYNQSAIKLLDGVLAIDPNNFEAYTYKSSVAMSLHQFAEAKTLAEKARTINPMNAYVYGVLVDANVELGDYKEAIAMSDQMQRIKPSLEAYSRASYLREIMGDYVGSKQAMQMAVTAGVPGSESEEWARVALADLYLNTGKLDTAELLYKTSLQFRPQFPNAEIGLAKVEKARKNFDKAIAHTEAAITIVSEVAFVSLLGELYALKGDKIKSTEIRKDVLSLLEKGEAEQQDTKHILMKHNANRELALANVNVSKLDEALKFAKQDLAIRPNNIDANELVATIYYLQNDFKSASEYVPQMLSTNSKNATTLYKASSIYAKSGDIAKSVALKMEAQRINPTLDPQIVLAAN